MLPALRTELGDAGIAPGASGSCSLGMQTPSVCCFPPLLSEDGALQLPLCFPCCFKPSWLAAGPEQS